MWSKYINLSISNFERRKLTHECRRYVFIIHEFLHMRAYASFLPPPPSLSLSRALSLHLLSQGVSATRAPRGLMTITPVALLYVFQSDKLSLSKNSVYR